jgi:hypothetical protein
MKESNYKNNKTKRITKFILIVILDINGLSSLIKRHKQIEWIFKKAQ